MSRTQADAVEKPNAAPAPRHGARKTPLLPICFGQDVCSGQPIVADLASLGHLLMAGQTGSGKTVSLTNVLVQLIRFPPTQVELVLFDPKMGVDLAPFADVPHLRFPVIEEPEDADEVLQLLLTEESRRYRRFREAGVRSLTEYQARGGKMPFLIVVIEELAHLFMVRPKSREKLIRLAQKARAAGIVLVCVTQRPSSDVLNGLLLANLASRLCFRVASRVNSQIVLDRCGAEGLESCGHFLFRTPLEADVVHGRGPLVDDAAIFEAVRQAQSRFPAARRTLALPLNRQHPEDAPRAAALSQPSSVKARTSSGSNLRRAASYLTRRSLAIGFAAVDLTFAALEWALTSAATWFRTRNRRKRPRRRRRRRQ